MPETIQCAHCQAPLRLPEQFIGQEVRCPACQKTFMAQMPAASPPPAAEQRREQPPSPIRSEPLANVRPSRRQPDYDDDDYDDAYSFRRYARVDRSSTVKILGIVGLALVALGLCVGIPVVLVGFGLGIAAVIMGRNDLALMKLGERDPAGRPATKTGVLCGTIAIVLTGVLLVLGCGFVVFMIAMDPK
jgi:hypothetical protein